MFFVTWFPILWSNGSIFSLILLLSPMHFQKPLLFFWYCCAVNSMWALAFLIHLWNLKQYFWISPKLRLLASTPCVHPLSLARNSLLDTLTGIDTGILADFCLTAYLLGWTTLQHELGDFWILISFLGPFFPAELYLMGVLQADLWRGGSYHLCTPGNSWVAYALHRFGSGWHPPWGPWPLNVNQRAWATCSWSAGLQQAPITTSTLSVLTQELQVTLH